MRSLPMLRLLWITSVHCTAAAVLLACSPTTQPTELQSATPDSRTYGGLLAGETITDKAWTQVIEGTLASVVKVNVVMCDGSGSGSGFFVNRTIITNRHVVDEAKAVSITLPEGTTVQADSWSWSTTDDLAWISVAPSVSLPSLDIAEVDVVSGDLVVGIGFPLGKAKTAERGRVVSFERPYERESSAVDVILMTNETLPGDSGGPLVDTSGRVSGVVFAMDLQRNLSMAIRASRLRDFLDHVPPRRVPRQCNGGA